MSSRKGNYYRLRTKSFLERQGYYVENLERYNRVFSNGKVIFQKQDVLASDLVALSQERGEIIFVNSVFGKANIARAIKNFMAIPFPKIEGLKRYVIAWEQGAREPEVVEVIQ